MAALRERYSALTPRERDVLPLVVSGLLNKQAAAELGISEVTLQIHRRNVMQKMGGRFARRSRAHGGEASDSRSPILAVRPER